MSHHSAGAVLAAKNKPLPGLPLGPGAQRGAPTR
jgi:hypothetical protein